ncbi:MAG: DUF4469 domain-containing protein [Treponema sp.]|jgi:hypothetical protein|nr:DUF4469 domain-containing protein [Treponema sp.]
MAITTNELGLIFHRIRAKLYPNHLQNVKGEYIARTSNEDTLSIDEVCAIMKTRAGFTGKYEDLLVHVHQYIDEAAYQLCDGYAVTNGYYTVYPNIGGSFSGLNETHDHKKHPISFRFRVRAKLKNLIKNIQVNIDSIADTGGFIDTFTDQEEDSVNGVYVPGNMFAIHGSKIKIAGDDPSLGVYFVPVNDPSKAVKVSRIGKNNPTEITGIAPNTEHQDNRIEIRTRFSGNDRLLKEVRTIRSAFVIEAC